MASCVHKTSQNLNLKLLYKASVNGDRMEDVYGQIAGHRRCFIVVETAKGYKFGGFRTKPFTRGVGGM